MKVADLIRRLDETAQNLMESLYMEEGSLEVEDAIVSLAKSHRIKAEIPLLDPLLERLLAARQSADHDRREQALIDLYLQLHSGGALCLPREHEKLTGYSGHTCLPAGLFIRVW
ncbi:hypothetical protein ACFLU6_03815 [Acidobacteriota bacterium]